MMFELLDRDMVSGRGRSKALSGIGVTQQQGQRGLLSK